MDIECLPDELLLGIFGYLQYEDIVSLQYVSKRLSLIAKDESLWKCFCEKIWLLNEKEKTETWRDTFIKSYLKFCGKRYQRVHPKIKYAWNKLQSFLEINNPAIWGSLEDGMSENEIDEFETIHQTKLPDSLRLFYRLYKSQRDDSSPGLFGSMLQYGSSSTLVDYGIKFIPLTPYGIIKYWNENQKIESISVIFGESAAGLKLSVVLPYGQNTKQEFEDNYKYTVSVEPESQASYSSLAKNIISPNFEEWFAEHVSRVVTGCYDIHQGAILRYYYDPSCVSRTHHITVKAGWTRFFHRQILSQALFEYRIVLKMDEDAPERESCMLLDRHWYILADGEVLDEVHGKGVVGDQPIMRPGSTYSWVSRTSFHGPKGSMRGHFTMQYLNRPKRFELECPEFFMHCGINE